MIVPLTARSESRLVGVHDDLVRVTRRAHERLQELFPGLTFDVTEGLRSAKRQEELFNSGASTIRSGGRHQTGHAVDVMVKVNGQGRWDWPLYFKAAQAFRSAAMELGVPVRWGGVWDKQLSQYADPEKESQAYIDRRRAAGVSRPFVDGPHFELPASKYPAA